MPTLSFTANLRRHVQTPTSELDGPTLGAALEGYFADYPTVRGYLLDDQGAVRKHVAIFINGQLIADRRRLSDPLRPGDSIFIAQALSGG